MSAFLFLEGGGSGPNSKELDIRCREGFRKLLEKCGFGEQQRMPRLFACGGRAAVLDDFSTAQTTKRADEYLAMWIDSEERMADINVAWNHLQNVTTVPKRVRPTGATDDQVLFMATCMETWIVADRQALTSYYGSDLQENALPPLDNLEQRSRHDIQERLSHATRDCTNPTIKGSNPSFYLESCHPIHCGLICQVLLVFGGFLIRTFEVRRVAIVGSVDSRDIPRQFDRLPEPFGLLLATRLAVLPVSFHASEVKLVATARTARIF